MSEQQPPPPPPQPDAADAAAAKKPWWKRWWGITGIVIAALVVLVGVTGDPEEEPEPDQAAAEDEQPDEASETDSGPESDDGEEGADNEPAEPEPEPEPEPEEPEPFEPVEFSGQGDDIVTLDAYDRPVVVTMTHDGSQNFAVELIAGGDTAGLLANAIGSYEGTVPLNFGQLSDNPEEADVTADGAWTMTVTAAEDQPALSETSEGAGDEVLVADGDGRLALTHDGQENFAVIAHNGMPDLLVNEIGSYEGTNRLGADAEWLQITADGNWTAALQ